MSDVIAEMVRAGTAFSDPTLDLLHQRDAQVTTAIFNACFPREVRTIPVDRMHSLVEDMLNDLRVGGHTENVPNKSGRELCTSWRTRQWLLRDVDDSGEFYALTSAAQSALQTVSRLTRERTSVSEHRISHIVGAIRNLNATANPSRLARIDLLEHEIQELDARLQHLRSGAALPAVSADYMLDGFLEILALVSDLPGDFQRVQESFARQRVAVLEQFRNAGQAAGEVVGAYLDQSDALMNTMEGRAFQGALELLRDPEMLDRLASDLHDLLEHPTSVDILNAEDRADLSGIARTLTSGISSVIARRQRVTQVLRQNIQAYNAENDRQLEGVLRELDAALAPWLARTGSRTRVHLALLPSRPEIRHLRERMHDPADDLALEPAEHLSGQAPEPMTLAQLRALGGPNMPMLRRHLEAAWQSDTAATLASAFATLPEEARRPADLLGALQVAADCTLVGRDGGSERVSATRPDGTVRTWLVPRFVVGAEQTSKIDLEGLDDTFDMVELEASTQEIA